MKFTDDEKRRLHELFAIVYGSVKLKCDGEECEYHIRNTSSNSLKFEAAPFVNGKFEFRWLMTNNEEFGSKLLRTRMVYLRNKKTRDEMKKINKKTKTTLFWDIDAKIKTKCFFDNSAQLIKHLEATFETVQILEAV